MERGKTYKIHNYYINAENLINLIDILKTYSKSNTSLKIIYKDLEQIELDIFDGNIDLQSMFKTSEILSISLFHKDQFKKIEIILNHNKSDSKILFTTKNDKTYNDLKRDFDYFMSKLKKQNSIKRYSPGNIFDAIISYATVMVVSFLLSLLLLFYFTYDHSIPLTDTTIAILMVISLIIGIIVANVHGWKFIDLYFIDSKLQKSKKENYVNILKNIGISLASSGLFYIFLNYILH